MFVSPQNDNEERGLLDGEVGQEARMTGKARPSNARRRESLPSDSFLAPGLRCSLWLCGERGLIRAYVCGDWQCRPTRSRAPKSSLRARRTTRAAEEMEIEACSPA